MPPVMPLGISGRTSMTSATREASCGSGKAKTLVMSASGWVMMVGES